MKRIALYRFVEFMGLLAPIFLLIAFLVSVEVFVVWKHTGSFHKPSEFALSLVSLITGLACFSFVRLRVSARPWIRNAYILNGFAWLLVAFLSIARCLD
ncbi:MAG: hypothetical protein A3H57_02865 [Candidatus Taylorbacteria bacterium RIFCSPLOWO2_02_FULL_43_11]|uniref:Uncharacterized protein n=1 Tax=Candidatus Taylorbacteria bacterium RIFCSPHIGHO2_02_FULL_43_32b TaxID=1802306 RepID=A0A1G2MIF2_9BACT|nr:MAG: hypothetical protein A2743_04415 [Candidatus Taylorbacteria bacterium RIFCSPHIGHO2_01_FULL_43_47]OHA23504.1 MAG: hypothetical protein A3C72_00470 [Candidatus Taylorbacteria bacterium RIFCSPHIGHO2_02_FULL_43_32b]OHA30483.1 MAG: hypothetical protein A3B08_04260 [Candidatus Taylorbacteria bacterium RIFCSPLOWO2_01_FULL_43_44]OHA36931.1 MAG: hypothetical protein A3H57_02865 [Candidatus Taylorbacteria bacterium RIFCSPLOWO2_02_FULL_43_11]